MIVACEFSVSLLTCPFTLFCRITMLFSGLQKNVGGGSPISTELPLEAGDMGQRPADSDAQFEWPSPSCHLPGATCLEGPPSGFSAFQHDGLKPKGKFLLFIAFFFKLENCQTLEKSFIIEKKHDFRNHVLMF